MGDPLIDHNNAGYVDVYNPTNRMQYNTEGVPRGSIISPLCANIFPHPLDCYVEDVLIPKYNVGGMCPASAEYSNKRLNLNIEDKAVSEDHPQFWQAMTNMKKHFVGWIGTNKPSHEPDHKKGATRLKYLRYADEVMSGIIGSKEEALNIRKAVQKFLQQKLKLEINEQRSSIVNAKSEIAKYLGTLVTYYGIGSVKPRSSTDEVSDVKRVRLRSITRPQLIAPIKDLLTKAVERGYGKLNAKGLIRATFNQRLAASEDEQIVTHFSSVIRGIVNYYSFVNKRSSLWKVVSIYRKSCALTLARKHSLRSAEAAFHKFGPNLRIIEKGRRVASLYYPNSMKTIGKYNIKASRFNDVTILEEPYYKG